MPYAYAIIRDVNEKPNVQEELGTENEQKARNGIL